MAELTEAQVIAKKLRGSKPIWPVAMTPANPDLPLQEWSFIQRCWSVEASARPKTHELVARARVNNLMSSSAADIPLESTISLPSLFNAVQHTADATLLTESITACLERNPIAIARGLVEYHTTSDQGGDIFMEWSRLMTRYRPYVSERNYFMKPVFSPDRISRIAQSIQANEPLFPAVADATYMKLLEVIFCPAYPRMSLLGAFWQASHLNSNVSSCDILSLALRLLRAKACPLPENAHGRLDSLSCTIDLSNVEQTLCDDIIYCTRRILYQWLITVPIHSLMNLRLVKIQDLVLLFFSAFPRFSSLDVGVYRLLVSHRFTALVSHLDVAEDVIEELEHRRQRGIEKGISMRMLIRLDDRWIKGESLCVICRLV